MSSNLALVMIVKNEEEMLKESVHSVLDVVDGVYITDTGSTDTTLSIIRELTDKVCSFAWIDDFSAARNFAEKDVTEDYILTWDADQLLQEKSIEVIKGLKERAFDGIDLINASWVTERNSQGEPVKILPKPFIYRRGVFKWESPVHNRLTTLDPSYENSVKYIPEIVFTHHKEELKKAWRFKQTLDIIEKEIESNPDNPQMLFYRADQLMRMKKYRKAQKAFDIFIQKYRDVYYKDAAVALEYICFSYYQRGEAQSALAYIEKFLGDDFIRHPVAILAYADCLMANEKVTQANQQYERYYAAVVKPYLAGDAEKISKYQHNVQRYIVHPAMMYLQAQRGIEGLPVGSLAKLRGMSTLSQHKDFFEKIS